MAIRYYKLFDILNRRGLIKKDIVGSGMLSGATMAKISRGDTVNTETIDKLCEFLNVQPGDIMEYVPETSEEKEIRQKRMKEKSAKDKARRKK